MVADVARLFLGLLVVLFHRPIAEYILAREQALDNMIRSRGVRLLPEPPSAATAHTIYFFTSYIRTITRSTLAARALTSSATRASSRTWWRSARPSSTTTWPELPAWPGYRFSWRVVIQSAAALCHAKNPYQVRSKNAAM